MLVDVIVSPRPRLMTVVAWAGHNKNIFGGTKTSSKVRSQPIQNKDKRIFGEVDIKTEILIG